MYIFAYFQSCYIIYNIKHTKSMYTLSIKISHKYISAKSYFVVALIIKKGRRGQDSKFSSSAICGWRWRSWGDRVGLWRRGQGKGRRRGFDWATRNWCVGWGWPHWIRRGWPHYLCSTEIWTWRLLRHIGRYISLWSWRETEKVVENMEIVESCTSVLEIVTLYR